MRESEERVCKALRAYFAGFSIDATFTDGPDPPDALFKVDGKEWGVEITSLHQYIDHEGNEESFAGVFGAAEHIVCKVRDQTRADALVGWRLHLEGPYTKDESVAITKECVAHIQSGATSELALKSASGATLSPVLEPLNVGLGVGLAYETKGADGTAHHMDYDATLNYALDRILTKKGPDLKKMKAYARRVLLIESHIVFVDPEDIISRLDHQQVHGFNIDLVFLYFNGQIELVSDPAGYINPFLKGPVEADADSLPMGFWARLRRCLRSLFG